MHHPVHLLLLGGRGSAAAGAIRAGAAAVGVAVLARACAGWRNRLHRPEAGLSVRHARHVEAEPVARQHGGHGLCRLDHPAAFKHLLIDVAPERVIPNAGLLSSRHGGRLRACRRQPAASGQLGVSSQAPPPLPRAAGRQCAWETALCPYPSLSWASSSSKTASASRRSCTTRSAAPPARRLDMPPPLPSRCLLGIASPVCSWLVSRCKFAGSQWEGVALKGVRQPSIWGWWEERSRAIAADGSGAAVGWDS